MTAVEIFVAVLVEIQAMLIAWAIYPLIFDRKSRRSHKH